MKPVLSTSPLVTAIVLCYNHARFVRNALDSVKGQTYGNTQLIVVDDCSRDDSVMVIEQWLGEFHHGALVIRHETNQGICRSLNEALRHAEGKYIGIIAADDTWLPEKTSKQVSVLEIAGPKVGVVYSDAYLMDEKGVRLPGKFIETHSKHVTPPMGDLSGVLCHGNFIPAMATLIRKSCYDKVGYYDEDLPFEDWDMWLRISAQYEFAYMSEVTASYRIVSTSMIRTRAPELEEASGRVLLKFLAANRVGDSARKSIVDVVLQKAVSCYPSRRKGSRRLLRSALKHDRSLHGAMLLLATHLAAPSRVISKLDRLARRESP